MKPLIRLPQDLVWLALVGVGLVFWQRQPAGAGRPPPPRPPIRTLHQGVPPAVFSPAEPTNPPPWDPPPDTLALIHLKLRQWSETQTGDRATQDRLLNELLALLTDDNAAEIIQSLSPDELNGPCGIAALFRWLKTDPMAAANWIAARPDASEDQAWVVAHNLLVAGVDVQHYSDQLPDTGWKQKFLAEATLGALSKDPMAAVNLAQRMNPGRDQTNLLQTIASDWISNDPNAALDWIQSVKIPAMQQQLIVAAAKAYAVTDPGLSAKWLVASVPSDDVINDALPNILDLWAGKDPAAAADWVAEFPGGILRGTGVQTVASRWLQSDPAAARNWILTLPESNPGEPAEASSDLP